MSEFVPTPPKKTRSSSVFFGGVSHSASSSNARILSRIGSSGYRGFGVARTHADLLNLAIIFSLEIIKVMERPAQFRDPDLETSGEIIGFYPREFYVFDNFSSFQVDYAGRRWLTSEHAYQASHFLETAPELADTIFEARSAHDAYKIAKANGDKAPENWGEIKTDVMYEICKLKMLQNPYVREKLLLSGDLEIVEDSTKDDFWGWGPNRDGRNELGKIWMRLRDELRMGDIVTE